MHENRSKCFSTVLPAVSHHCYLKHLKTIKSILRGKYVLQDTSDKQFYMRFRITIKELEKPSISTPSKPHTRCRARFIKCFVLIAQLHI